MVEQGDGQPIQVPNAVRVGGMPRAALLQNLRAHQIQLNAAAEALFADDRFETNSRDERIEIIAVSVADLGFAGGATYCQLTARAHESGLAECPLELGPHLRMQFLDQLEDSTRGREGHGGAPSGSITVASSPLDESDETPKGFYLRHVDGVLWLRGYWSWKGHIWSPDDMLVFSKSSAQSG